MSDKISLFITSVSKLEDAQNLARQLVEQNLAGCVSLITQACSYYHWKGQLCSETEILVLIKTNESSEIRLKERVLEVHPYETPELIQIHGTIENPGYAEWFSTQLSSK